MAAVNVKRPADLLGRSVCGSYRYNGTEFAFSGVVQAVVLPAPSSPFQVEFYVGDEYISLADCFKLDYVR